MSFEKRLRKALQKLDEGQPVTAPPVAPPRPSRPQPRRQTEPADPQPFRPLRPKQDPSPKNKREDNPAFRPSRPKHGRQVEEVSALQAMIAEAYEDETHPSTQKFWSDLPTTKNHAFGKHPLFAMHGDQLSRSAYQHTKEKSEASGLDMQQLMQVMQQIMQIESQHADELVDLAKKITVKIWKIPEEMLEGNLGPDVDKNVESDDGYGDEDDYSTEDGRDLSGEVNKRLTMNSMTHGSAVHAMMTMHHLVDKEIERIDPRLLKLYSQISSGSVQQYWLWNIPQMLGMLGSAAVGSSNVKWDENEPKIEAKAICFPVLAQEMSKGAAELISQHGLADMDEPTARTVLNKADDIRHEPYLIQIGPEIWRRFLKVRPQDIPLANIMQALAVQSPDDLHKIIGAVIEDPDEARTLLADLVSQPKQFDIDDYDEDPIDDEQREPWGEDPDSWKS